MTTRRVHNLRTLRKQVMLEARANMQSYRVSRDPIFLSIARAWVDMARRYTRRIFFGSENLKRSRMAYPKLDKLS